MAPCKNRTARLLFSLTLSTLSLFSFSLSAVASTLTIKNENKKELDIVIQSIVAPSDKPVSKEISIPAKTTIKVEITKKDLDNKETYFVKGKTGTVKLLKRGK